MELRSLFDSKLNILYSILLLVLSLFLLSQQISETTFHLVFIFSKKPSVHNEKTIWLSFSKTAASQCRYIPGLWLAYPNFQRNCPKKIVLINAQSDQSLPELFSIEYMVCGMRTPTLISHKRKYYTWWCPELDQCLVLGLICIRIQIKSMCGGGWTAQCQWWPC